MSFQVHYGCLYGLLINSVFCLARFNRTRALFRRRGTRLKRTQSPVMVMFNRTTLGSHTGSGLKRLRLLGINGMLFVLPLSEVPIIIVPSVKCP